jgi:hypothetical protein
MERMARAGHPRQATRSHHNSNSITRVFHKQSQGATPRIITLQIYIPAAQAELSSADSGQPILQLFAADPAFPQPALSRLTRRSD